MTRNLLIEEHVELAAIDWLKNLGYSHVEGGSLHRNFRKVVLEDMLRSFIERQYQHLPSEVVAEVMQEFTYNKGADLDIRNRDFHLKLSKGIDWSWTDKQGKEHQEHIYCVDYANPENNEFLAVNQFTIDGTTQRRPDLVIFINGLPIAVFEFKNMFDGNVTVDDAFNQIQHYKIHIPLLFEYNALTVVSDGLNTMHGMYSSDKEWFAPWKSVDGLQVAENDFQLQSLIKGLFPKERLLQYIRFYIFHENTNSVYIKKGAKYHQFFGIQFAVEHTKQAIKPIGDGRIGVIWHTQGSGKSISMAIYAAIISKLPELKNPTVVVQVDRNDLDLQLFENFVAAKDLVGEVKRAETTEQLRDYLSGEGGGVIFSTIEKFRIQKDKDEIKHPVLSIRDNVIVIADECHRTQYGLLEGFARNLRNALPNASFIGFTGTPVDKKDADTTQVFGEVIHTYDIRQAVEDKATVRIFYEPRLAKLHLSNEDIDEEAEEITTDVPQNEANKIKWAAIEDAAGSDKRVPIVAEDLLSHYLKRAKELPGKAMVVCMSRRNCVKLYNALKNLDNCPEIAVVMTANLGKDPKDWSEHFRTSKELEAIKKRFKDPDDPLKMVIVRDMWLTGFDAPCVHTLYVDKIMTGHNLMQAIARVNRVFRDKPNGLIVDYIGIGDRLKDATKKYTGGGGTGKPTYDIDLAFEEMQDVLSELKTYLPDGLSYDNWKGLNNGDKLVLVSTALNHVIKDDDQCESFMLAEKKMSALVNLIAPHEDVEQISLDILFFQHLGVAVRKIKHPVAPTKVRADQIKELIHRSIDSDKVVDVYAMAGLEKPDISILNEEFLLGARDQKAGADIKIELLRQILNNEISLRRHKNIVKYTSLKEEVEKVIARYHDNAIDSYTTILELVRRAQEMTGEDERARNLGLSDEEMAFYEILAKHQQAITDNALISDLVRQIVKDIKRNLQVDWYKKPDTKAEIMLAVKKALRGKVSIDELNTVLAEIMEQATARWKEWSLEAA
jgi:type I restriction enzyme R subunit